MNKATKNSIIFLSLALVLQFSGFGIAQADGGLVPTCNTKIIHKTVQNPNNPTHSIDVAEYSDPCDFTWGINLINNIIHFLLIDVATPLAALIICWAGFLLITAGGSSENINKAKKILKNLVIGYVIALAAWIIVHTIYTTLNFKGPDYLVPQQSNGK